MTRSYEGRLDASGMRVAMVASRFNDAITRLLVQGAQEGLRRLGCADADMAVAWVPGSLELPLAARRLAESGSFDAVVCLGAVVRGATAHFDVVAKESAAGVARVSADTGVPVVFGVLTTDTIDQAFERAGAKGSNKGADAAAVAVEMVDLLRRLPGPGDAS
ncbi:MAG: 6,7-dimethyl-8-ribityllumazine synthase [Acidimicrobiia bacterium]